MSDLDALIQSLRQAGIVLRVDAGNLVVKAPKGAVTDTLSAQIRAHKSELLAFLQTAEASRKRQRSRIGPSSNAARDGLSEAQKRLWFLDQLEGASSTYNMPLAVKIHGDLDIERLGWALGEIASRHETLRTRFEKDGDSVRAVIDAKPQIELELLPPPDSSLSLIEQIHLACGQAAQKRFVLSQEHPITAALQLLSDGSHLLMVTLHHIAADGWSLANLISELSRLYEAPEKPLPALPVQYADYVDWREQQEGSVAEHIEWWKEELADAPELTVLAYDRTRPAVATYSGAEWIQPLAIETIEAVKQAALRTDSTPYIVLLAAFSLFIHRAADSRQVEELVLGTTVANRDLAELEALIGLFINMLPLRLAPGRSRNVQDLIIATKNTFLNAYEHRDIAFERIVETVNPPRALNHSPLFQMTFDVQNQPAANLSLGNCLLDPVPPEATHSKFDLSVTVELAGPAPHIQWLWDTSILDQETVELWARNFDHLIKEFSRPEAHLLDAIGSLEPNLRDQWINTQRSTRRNLESVSWISLFENIVDQYPTATAVSTENQSYSYAELRNRAQVIAQALVESGVRPGDRVIVLKHRDPDLIACMIAVHYSGASYIPLDPAYPEERLNWVVEDSRPKIILTESSLAASFVLKDQAFLILERVGKKPSWTKLPGACVHNTAYIIFTSGSTGRPKGVSVGHLALMNFLCSMRKEPGLDRSDNLLAVTTVSFDIAVLELFLPLIVGAKITIANRLDAVDGRALADTIKRESVTCLQATPSTWRLLLNAGWRSAGLFKALCGGEALPVSLAREISATGSQLWNMYGPTETTIWSAVRHVSDAAPTPASGNEPVGYAIDNTYLYVLSESLELVGPGCVGELWIGGRGLAEGYWDRPGQTAERYRPDPFSGDPGARMYGTGDLVRIRADNHLDFLGRIDNQIKLRGFRIELGDIESALMTHPGVSAATVIATGGDPETRQLVAFVQTSLSNEDFRPTLRERLPAYMQPSSIIPIPKLPLTPNGKIDRPALMNLATVETKTPSHTPAQTQTQTTVSAVWSEFLATASPDIDTNVFELGAHSLMFTQFQQRLSEALNRPIELIDLFRYPTIRTLSEFLEKRPGKPLVQQATARAVSDEIAVIGAAGVLPGAADINEFWSLLAKGESGIREFTLDELRSAGLEETLITDPAFVPSHGAIDGIEFFDAAYFGITPAEARLIDPQHRLFMENAVHALENAGYARFDQPQNIGIYAGSGQNDYLIDNVLPFLSRDTSTDPYDAIIASEKDFLATRLSYQLNLTGPSLNIQTACSTGLVAVHSACRALRAGECSMALAGAVALRIPQANGHLYRENMIVSPDGQCRPFDEHANGVVWGSGVVAFVLKPMDNAIADRDHVMAVIKGSAINNDGSAKVGFTAPSIEGQAALIHSALADAALTPSDIQFVETHGTATALGDMIEFGALRDVRQDSELRCYLGAVKSQVGHLNHAAGAAGLLKLVMALQNRHIPASPYFNTAHQKLESFETHFAIPTDGIAWPSRPDGRVGAVSSFGIGGTNAHVIVGEAPTPTERTPPDRMPQILALSARGKDALERRCRSAVRQWAELDRTAGDVAWTLINGAEPMPYRGAVVATRLKDASDIENPVLSIRGKSSDRGRACAFLFPGQGAQAAGQAGSLYDRYSVFRRELDTCADQLNTALGIDLIALCCRDSSPQAARLLEETWLTQPVLLAIEYALARLWMSWGVQPAALLGHSLGEITAACLSGIFDLPTALDLARMRGQICWDQKKGAMVSVAAPREQISELLDGHPEVDLAAINSPTSTVLAGMNDAIESVIHRLELSSIRFKRLAVSHPFHSRWMKPGIRELASFLDGKQINPPQIKIVSCFTSKVLTDAEAMDPVYWAKQLTAPVQFGAALNHLCADNALALLEVGPGRTLTSLANDQAQLGDVLISAGTTETDTLLESAARLWCNGVSINLENTLEQDEPITYHRAPIPPYPFERARHWLSQADTPNAARLPMEKWFTMPEWRLAPMPQAEPDPKTVQWLLLGKADDWLAEKIAELAPVPYTPEALTDQSDSTGIIVCLSRNSGQSPVIQARNALVEISSRLPGVSIPVRFICQPIHRVSPSNTPDIQFAMLRGLLLVARQEMPSLNLRCIEIDDCTMLFTDSLRSELSPTASPSFVAYRQGERFIPGFVPIPLPALQPVPNMLKQNGLYLISGGTGRLGLTLARYLQRRVGGKSILLARKAPETIPAEIEHFCSIVTCDVGSEQEVASVAASLLDQGIRVDGVIHAAGNPNLVESVQGTPTDWPWPSLSAKVDGARNLAKYFAKQSEWGLLISSLASQLGGLGYAEYAVANAGLDAVAQEITADLQKPWRAVNLDAIAFSDDQPRDWISPKELDSVMDRVFALFPLRQICVSTSPIAGRTEAFTVSTEQEVLELPAEMEQKDGMTRTEAVIVSVWEQLLGYDGIGLDDDYFDLGGDSLKAVRVVEILRGYLDHPVPMTFLVQHPTARKLAAAIDAGGPQDGQILVPMNSTNSEHRLILLPGTGGSIMYLTELARHLGQLGHQCIGLQALGLDALNPPRDTIEEIAQDNLCALDAGGHENVTLIGHSFGGWVGLEMVRQYAAKNHPIPNLIVLDSAAPARRSTDALQAWTDTQWIESAAQNIFATFNAATALTTHKLRGKTWEEMIELLHEEMVDSGLLPPSSSPEFVSGIVGVFRSQAKMVYDPPAEPQTRISLVRAEEQLAGFLDGIPDHLAKNPTWGWCEYSTESVKLLMCSGNHLNMVSRTNAANLVEQIKALI